MGFQIRKPIINRLLNVKAYIKRRRGLLNPRNRILSLPRNPRFLLPSSPIVEEAPNLKHLSLFIRLILRFPHEIRPSSLRSRFGSLFPTH
ncbi:hypothetical protein MRB53_012900 [Persea americana]|uniref:Uncharacterized protein n=1 Tax=Persea americana TaxID=3435 RepID=A0ACC2LZ24_PERAE|nr:hypothetical protein MRB53_012900 [Persea americana]